MTKSQVLRRIYFINRDAEAAHLHHMCLKKQERKLNKNSYLITA